MKYLGAPRLKCARCFGHAPLSNKAKLEAFKKRGPCRRTAFTAPKSEDFRRPRLSAPPRVGDAEIDASHSIAHFRGVLWCTVCGCYATVKVGLLRLRCKGAANRGGQEALRALNSVPPKLPKQKPWPEETPRHDEMPSGLIWHPSWQAGQVES